MNILPNKLAVLDDTLEPIEFIQRLDEQGAIGGRTLKEHDYDNIFVKYQDLVADALREAAVIEASSELIHLGKIFSIDMLFAEVDKEDQTFRRFVIVEDKLFRNPEAHREVLSQIFEYATKLRKASKDDLYRGVSQEHHGWLDDNESLIEQALQNADFLLIICGDRIRPRLIEYVEHFKSQLGPLSSIDIALLSLAIFSNGSRHILVPYVVALVTSERDITIKVVVQDKNGEPLSATIDIQKDETKIKRRGERIEYEELIAAIRRNGGDEAVQTAKTLFEYAENLGAEVKLRGASASVRLKDQYTGKYSTLFVVTGDAKFYIGWLERWESNAGVSHEVAANYEKKLTEILGKSPRVESTTGKAAIPLTKVGKHLEEVLDAIRVAIQALSHKE